MNVDWICLHHSSLLSSGSPVIKFMLPGKHYVICIQFENFSHASEIKKEQLKVILLYA